MQSFLHPKPFYILNLILFVIFCITVNPNNSFSIIYNSFYCIFHFLLIYLSIYHFNKILYLIYFAYGLILDILWFNEIGPHLLGFILMIAIVQISLKFLYNLNSLKIYFFLIVLQLLIIFSEMFLSYILFNYKLDTILVMETIIISITLSIPVFIIFSKIDEV